MLNPTLETLKQNYIIQSEDFHVYEFFCKEIDRLKREVSLLKTQVHYRDAE